MNEFLKVRLKLEEAIKKMDKLYRENQVMKKRLLKYEKQGMLYHNNKKGLNDNTQV
jgi:hypothetical protein|tara:strand:- start:107 stop:274 length:168 start_codon:yes stop_codon:yes gene_type:complete